MHGPGSTTRTSKWRWAGGYWLVQGLVLYLLPALLVSPDLSGLAKAHELLLDSEYAAVVSSAIVCLMTLQAGFLAPLKAKEARSVVRPSVVRLLASGMSIGILVVMVITWLLPVLAGPDSISSYSDNDLGVFWTYVVIAGGIATAVLRYRFGTGMPAGISLMIAGLMSGLLIAGIIFLLLNIVSLATGDDPDMEVWGWILLGAPALTWVVMTPLLVAFVEKGSVETQLSRIASRLFIGTVVELLCTLPFDIMVRRKSSCYCGEGTFWTLVLSLSVGAVVLGPAVILLPVRRRQLRMAQGKCRACGYDMSGTSALERCPECGAGWKAA